MKRLMILLIAVAVMSPHSQAQPKPEPKPTTIAEKVAGMEKFPGYFTFYWDSKSGTLWLEIDKWNSEFLYVSSLPAGIGSNDIGLDRGQISGERIVKFERSGPKVLLVQPNYDYRANSTNADEVRAVEEAFAQSVLWGFDVSVEEGSRVLVDATSFYLRDSHDVIGALKQSNQGSYRLDLSRCAFYLPHTKNFPQNTEVEVTLTFTGDEPGSWVRQVVPTPQAITVREHQSFVQLPDAKYTPRAFDPRAGYFGMSYMDFATPISEPIVKRFITRHRLQKTHPNATMSEVLNPIVYYVDRGAPEPVRSALLEGAGWWSKAFEAAGFKNAFRVELMPEGADPMDIRYNIIQWVHRATRGWSYGGSVSDPRTGEILKGAVSLGSLRDRQDYLIAEGLLAPYEKGKSVSPELEKMVLARLRQLAAHEVGHTLGLGHNYIASTVNRASVMDYPYPLVTIKNDNSLDLSDSYATGVGDWDKVAIAYGYQEFPSGTSEKQALDSILNTARTRGLIFLTDQDARPPGSAQPFTHLWDNGTNAVDELLRLMRVRSIALSHFGENNIRPGAPLATLEEVLVPLYLGHRYQIEAAAKVLGGVNYTYALRDDGQVPTALVPANEQRQALDALLSTIAPVALTLPESILKLIPPHPAGYERHRELFSSRTGLTFDALAPAEVLANHTVSFILNPERATRLVQHHAREASQPGLDEVIDKLISKTWKSSKPSGLQAEVQRSVNYIVMYNLMSLASMERATPQVHAIATIKLSELKTWLWTESKSVRDLDQRAQYQFALSEIERFLQDPKKVSIPHPIEAPPGQPIGDFGFEPDWD
jgi:predicted Zn-dependent protease